jgi:hypothetical protein
MMQWKKDLESLVEQTKAMVKQVNLKQVEPKQVDPRQIDPKQVALKQVNPNDVDPAARSEPPPLPDPAVRSATPIRSAVPYRASMPHNWAKPELAFDRPAREEIIQRVEGFRAHQEKLRREREDYYLEMTEKMRAILRDDIERKH